MSNGLTLSHSSIENRIYFVNFKSDVNQLFLIGLLPGSFHR